MIDQSDSKQNRLPEKEGSEPEAEGLLDNLGLAPDFPLQDIYRGISVRLAHLEPAMEVIRGSGGKKPPESSVAPRTSVAPPQGVRSGLPANPPGVAGQSAKPQVSATLIAWMEDRRSRLGDEAKKVLHAVALAQFPDLKARDFDAAYKAVYARKKGRPRKPAG